MLKPQGLFWPAAAWKLTFLSFVFGRKRPKTKEKDGFSILPEGNVFSVVLAAKPPEQPKKMVISTLPQAEKPVMRPASAPTT